MNKRRRGQIIFITAGFLCSCAGLFFQRAEKMFFTAPGRDRTRFRAATKLTFYCLNPRRRRTQNSTNTQAETKGMRVVVKIRASAEVSNLLLWAAAGHSWRDEKWVSSSYKLDPLWIWQLPWEIPRRILIWVETHTAPFILCLENISKIWQKYFWRNSSWIKSCEMPCYLKASQTLSCFIKRI